MLLVVVGQRSCGECGARRARNCDVPGWGESL